MYERPFPQVHVGRRNEVFQRKLSAKSEKGERGEIDDEREDVRGRRPEAGRYVHVETPLTSEENARRL